jgi:hypothetical protein
VVENVYLRGPRRFWYLLAAGTLIGIVAAISVVDKVKPGVPPKLHPRTKASYTAQALALVDTKKSLFFVMQKQIVQPGGYHWEKYETTDRQGNTKVRFLKVPDGVTIKITPPNHAQATFYANLYPSLINSPDVVRLRQQLYPHLPKGTVSSFAVGSTTAASGRLRTARLPIIAITGTAHTKRHAIELAQNSMLAFQRYIAKRGDTSVKAGSGLSDPMLLRILSLPTTARSTKSSQTALAVAVGFLVLGGFVLLTMILERLFPRRERGAEADRAREPDGGDPLLEAELQRLRRAQPRAI